MMVDKCFQVDVSIILHRFRWNMSCARGRGRDKKTDEKNIVLNQNEKWWHFWVVWDSYRTKKESEWTGRSCLRWSILQALVSGVLRLGSNIALINWGCPWYCIIHAYVKDHFQNSDSFPRRVEPCKHTSFVSGVISGNFCQPWCLGIIPLDPVEVGWCYGKSSGGDLSSSPSSVPINCHFKWVF